MPEARPTVIATPVDTRIAAPVTIVSQPA
jgi:hypothetical protein